MRILVFILLVIATTSCGRFANKEQDNSGGGERIVSVSKQYTEIMYALGAEKNLVAVDVSSVYPPQVKKLPTVGYHRALSLESLLAAKPSVILEDGPESMGPEHVVTQLKSLQIPMKEFSTKATNIDSTKLLIREMATYFKKENNADGLCKKLDADMQAALDSASKYTDKPKTLIIHFGRAMNVYMVMKDGSTAGKMVEWAGGKMAISSSDAKSMRQISAELVAASDPDIIILTDFGYDRLGTKDKIKELPGVASTKAFKNNRIYRFEENDLVYLGPRTGENVLKLQQLIHPPHATVQ
ncbi:heme/hemin ABC transporter substrate-binding protein [Foetidibacter luteolus]|uniref:heme/hemin ABC transporter substrate-binding protein n=1 Tax=Foetidibacter luteolus TaxID=2608880 RepID=UPI00129A8F9B|nr:ABC transporter substrate-binding protein [Foetidibacter luteolus]